VEPSHRPARRRARPATMALAVVLAVLTLGAVAGCGLGTDEEAREIPTAVVPESLRVGSSPSTTAVGVSGDARRVTVYLVRSSRDTTTDSLEGVTVEVPGPSSDDDFARLVAESLVQARPDALGHPELINAVPPGTQVLRVALSDDGVLDLDLTELDAVEGSLQRLAVAQILFTLTELVDPRIQAVRFSVDGTPVAVPVEMGTIAAGQPVRRSDDPDLLAGMRAAAGG